MPHITNVHRTQFLEEGYFILERAVPEEQLAILRDSCDCLIEAMHAEMDRLGTNHIHISHRSKRYHIAKQYDQSPRLDEFVFSELMAEICRATLGDTAFLFYDQYVVKAAEQGMAFSWHQDSGYLGFPHTPYVTCWTAVDDMSLANGTAHVMPFSQIGIRTLVEHVRDEKTGDKAGYFGVHLDRPGLSKPYKTQVSRGGKQVSLGCFTTAEEAVPPPSARAAAAAAKKPILKDGVAVNDSIYPKVGVPADPEGITKEWLTDCLVSRKIIAANNCVASMESTPSPASAIRPQRATLCRCVRLQPYWAPGLHQLLRGSSGGMGGGSR